jgi:hypothetical protein
MTLQDVLDYIDSNCNNLEELKQIRYTAHKYIKRANQSMEKSNEISEVSEVVEHDMESIRLAKLLYDNVKENYSWFKKNSTAEQIEKYLETSANDIRKMNTIDNYNYEIIEKVINWTKEDEFWRQNIWSGNKLRKHFDTLLIRIKEEQSKKTKVYKI